MNTMMKKIFTLMSMAFVAMSVSAQDVYNAIVDGKLNTEFAAVAGENGGVANNTVDGKSTVTMTAGKATVTAVGGTTPANDATIGGGAQQITPGAVIDAEKHIYEVASVDAWNDINWGLKNQGDIDFWYVTGTGNPYVKMNAIENSKDNTWQGNYKADYVYYEPDGSVGMPITGLYYKFTASAAGAFKVKVFANKGHRLTFVVNASTMKAERLLASGYINGVNDESGKKKLLTVEQVDSVHHVYIWGDYEKEKKKYDEGNSLKTPEEMEQMLADTKASEAARQYVIGNGNQNFWGWLTFDVEAGEEYWVFQHSSQIGFGGFEFYEGKTAEELIQGIVAPYVYTTNFSTYEDEGTGERVTWKGEKAIGSAQFASDELDGETLSEATCINVTYRPSESSATKDKEQIIFGDYFHNNPNAEVRTSYCLLPDDVLANSDKTKALTIASWVRIPEVNDGSFDTPAASSYVDAPIFTAYTADGAYNGAMLACQYDGTLKFRDAGGNAVDYSAAQNVAGSNKVYTAETDWLADKKWHYYAAVFEGENAKVFIDGKLKNEWNLDGTTASQLNLFAQGADLKYPCLGGNAATAGVKDAPFEFARLLIKNNTMSAGEITTQMQADLPEGVALEEYHPAGISTVTMDSLNKNAAIYNLAGQRVDKNFKGLVVQDGKKLIVK